MKVLQLGRLKNEGDCIVAEVCDADHKVVFYVKGPLGQTRDDYPVPPLAENIIRQVNAYYPMLEALETIDRLGKSRYHDLKIDEMVLAAIKLAKDGQP